MKKALVGVANNIAQHYEKVKVWSKSFREQSDGEIVLFCVNSEQQEIDECQKLGITTIPVKLEDTWYINHKRLKFVLDFLKQTDIELFIITDVFDVVFQGNPFAKLDLENYDVFASQEGVNVNEEPWNHSNIGALFPQHVKQCETYSVVCSGIIAGKREALVRVYERMYDLCENHSTNDHNIKDQAAFIIMLASNEIPRVKLFNLNEGWAVNCAVAGPTQFFTGWGFKDRLVERNLHIPYLEHNGIKTAIGFFDMVHQFNRIPEWNEILTKPYLHE